MSCIISLFDSSKNDIVKSLRIEEIPRVAEERVAKLNEKLNKKPNKKDLYWKVTVIGV